MRSGRNRPDKQEEIMEKYIPYEKLSKKEKQKRSSSKRGTWGAVSPVTRKPAAPKAYNRRKAQSWKKEIPNPVLFDFPICYNFSNTIVA